MKKILQYFDSFFGEIHDRICIAHASNSSFAIEIAGWKVQKSLVHSRSFSPQNSKFTCISRQVRRGFASRVRAAIPATRGALALVPVWVFVQE